MDTISVSNIEIVPVRFEDGLVAFASCSINEAFYLGSLAIHSCPNNSLGFRIVYPSKKIKSSGKEVPIFFPFKKSAEEVVTKAIVSKYLELMSNFHHVKNEEG